MSNINVTSQNQLGGITAGQIFIIHGPAVRKVSQEQEHLFVAHVSADHYALMIPVRLNDDSNEGRCYERALIQLINKIPRWRAFSQGMVTNTLPNIKSGLFLEVGNPQELPDGLIDLNNALNSAGIEFQLVQGPWKNDPSAFRLTIGFAD